MVFGFVCLGVGINNWRCRVVHESFGCNGSAAQDSKSFIRGWSSPSQPKPSVLLFPFFYLLDHFFSSVGQGVTSYTALGRDIASSHLVLCLSIPALSSPCKRAHFSTIISSSKPNQKFVRHQRSKELALTSRSAKKTREYPSLVLRIGTR